MIPTAGDARPTWKLEDFQQAVQRGEGGNIAVLQFHGVPDRAHPWVHTPPELFEKCMQYLADHQYTVIALRDLAQYIPAGSEPTDPKMVIRDRQQRLKTHKSFVNARTPETDEELRYWLENMFVYHHFNLAEMVAATGLAEQQINAAIERFQLTRPTANQHAGDRLLTIPYPGGRHPRIGFLDGEIRPQRETKFSVFTPWAPRDYVVLDIPEAIWMTTPQGNQLLYLAHTHVPTIWDQQGIELPELEWMRNEDGSLTTQREFPNHVTLAARIQPRAASVRMELELTNGTQDTLSGLRVQNCVMLKMAQGFNQQTNDNKVYRRPYAACRNDDGTRWIITAWQPCQRPWGNDRCPCLHSDPQFPDCAPGTTERLVGWLSFYEGTDIDAELKRIEATAWFND